MRSGHFTSIFFAFALISGFTGCRSGKTSVNHDREYDILRADGISVREAFSRSHHYLRGWLAQADSATGLIPRNLRESRDFWNAWDAGADNYPFMVLTAAILDSARFQGVCRDMLKTELRLSSRIGRLPDNYSFSRRGFQFDTVDLNRVIFGTAEYMKDGLIPLTEWLGPSPWSDRMLGMLADLPKVARRATDIRGNWYGNSATVEVNGDLLQVLSRMYWFTRDTTLRDWVFELADHYLGTDGRLPTEALDRLRIRAHGCEIISGLCEAYIVAVHTDPVRQALWKPRIHRMLDRILEVGRNADGLFYDEVDPHSGKVLSSRIADNFGYTFNAYWHIGEIDARPDYQAAVKKGLASLSQNYRDHNWENGSADGDADAIEGALNLYQRAPTDSLASWMDHQIRRMWGKQQPNGIIEGWHGDGNFARTSLMYALWKTKGVTPVGWREDLRLSAQMIKQGVRVMIAADSAWSGQLRFDIARHKQFMHMPVDYPRINQFPEWFTVEPLKQYRVHNRMTRETSIFQGSALSRGIPVSLGAGTEMQLDISAIN